jgi:hypothetical protein
MSVSGSDRHFNFGHQIGFGVHPALSPVALHAWDKTTGACSWPITSSTKVKKEWNDTFTQQYIFTTFRLIKRGDNITF